MASSLEYDGVSFGKLDIETNENTKNRYQVKEVPDVRIFRRGVMFHYQGPSEHQGAKGNRHIAIVHSGKEILREFMCRGSRTLNFHAYLHQCQVRECSLSVKLIFVM